MIGSSPGLGYASADLRLGYRAGARLSNRLVFCCWFYLALLSQGALSQNGIDVTSAGAVHDLSDELVSRAHVHITATITYYDAPELLLFVQDSTGGVFVNVDRKYSFHAGQLISIDGTAKKDYRAEVGPNPKIQLIGEGAPVHPQPATYSALASGKLDCRLASIRGTVRDAVIEFHPESRSSTLHMDLSVKGGEVESYVNDLTDLDPNSLLGAQVQLTAVVGGSFDAKKQLNGVTLYVAGGKDIKILSRPATSPFSLPLTDIRDVFSTLRSTDSSPRLHVRGTIVYYASGESAVLEHDGRSLYLQTRETKHLAIGEVVDAYGFADNHNYSPTLREAVLLPTGNKEQIAPVPVTYSVAMSGIFSDQLISIEGQLVSQLHTEEVETITLNVDGHLIRGTIPTREHVGELPVGSRVRLSGICRIVTGGPWREPVLFSVASRTASDIRVVSSASWWTVEHLASLLGFLLVGASAIATWAYLLRLRVSGQSKQIKRSMQVARSRSEVLEKISNNMPLKDLLEHLTCVARNLLPGTSAELRFGSADEVGNYAHQATLFSCPLVSNEEYLGIFLVAGQPRCTEFEAKEAIQMLLELIALALRQGGLHDRLVHHSTHDPLTNLPNRRLSEEKINAAILSAAAKNGQLSIVYIDIDRFKTVNDKYGHRIGDRYLQAIGSRLSANLRTQDMLARIGGDEFVILLPGAGIQEARGIVDRLHDSFDLPFALEEISINGAASFGLASYPEHGVSREELERHADSAMYLAKHLQNGRGVGALEVLTTHELEKALAMDHFRLTYQPQFSPTGSLTGLEALIRLDDPILGTLTPGSFIAVAESTDFIVDLGDWVLRTALSQATEWCLGRQETVVLAVNIAARQLEQPDFASRVLAHLRECKFPAECLELELTERTLLSKSSEVLVQVELLTRAGVRVCLDDFGTDHSSLSLLHRLPISTVKIDRSFVKALNSETRVTPIVEAIVTMAERLQMRIVAEGIEDSDTIHRMLQVGQMDFQGFWFSHPVPSEEIPTKLDHWLSGISIPAR